MLLEVAQPEDVNLKAKVLARRAKLLFLLTGADGERLDDAEAACLESASATALKASLHRKRQAHASGSAVNLRIASMPRYRHPVKPSLEQ